MSLYIFSVNLTEAEYTIKYLIQLEDYQDIIYQPKNLTYFQISGFSS